MPLVRSPSKAFCKAWKLGAPLSASITISPSSHAVSNGMRRSAAVRCGSFGAQSWPLRVYRRTSPWSSRASNR